MKLTWDETGSRLFETGVSNGVLYPTDSHGRYTEGVAWNGLTSVTVSPEGGDPTPIYANNAKIAETYSFLEFNGSIEAYTYPDEFSDCLGFKVAAPGMSFGMQKRKRFGLVWRSKLGNDVNGINHGYKIHILYGCLAQLSEMAYSTVNEDPELITFSWPISTLPVYASGYSNTAYVEFDSTKTDPDDLYYLEQNLYGTDWSPSRLPAPTELIGIMGIHNPDYIMAYLAVLDNTHYPFTGTYEEHVRGLYPKYDIRRF